jgi:type I restriction enzyme M protein
MKCGRLIRENTGSRKYALYGQEAIGSTWALAKMNMFLHGEDNHRIEWGDTIRNPKLLDGDAASNTSTSSWPTRRSAWKSGA